MKYKATIHIMPRDEILDPQGKATHLGLQNLGFDAIEQVRIGKRIEIDVEAKDKQAAEAMVKEACTKLLANTVIEKFAFEIAG
jgi:phosphoribosylformylglycinamidine synthase PurS subunit